MISISYCEQTHAALKAKQQHELVECITEILILIDKQDRESCPDRRANPHVIFDHAERYQWHVIEIDQTASTKLSLICTYEGGKIGVAV
ncbi:hypothetical protein ASF08_23325 [Methylobacterium sp. Leaf85]|nr:hypothetical protein ASF08_23325 [Methylobacterium sp. Leaf85]